MFNRLRQFIGDPLRRAQLSVLALLSLILAGVIGYIILEGMTPVEALYMTIITITTVGFSTKYLKILRELSVSVRLVLPGCLPDCRSSTFEARNCPA